MDPSHAAILFDIDGTLVDSTYHHAIAWQRAFDGVGMRIPLWRIHRAVGMGGDKLPAHVAGESVERRHGDELRDRWRKEYAAIKDEVSALPGATDLVNKLAAGGYQVALASSGDPEFSREAVASLGVRKHIAVLTTAEDVAGSKPEPDLLGETLSRLDGVTHAVFVGDTPYDVESAKRAGLTCIALKSGGYCETELEGAALVVDLPEDLLGLDWEKYLSPVESLQ